MNIVAVPNYISEAIYRKVDAAIEKAPDAAPDREYFYGVLLNYFDQHGEIPDFELKAKVLSERDDIEESCDGK